MQQFQVIRDFEKALSDYTGAPFVTCVNSCTMALRLCLDYARVVDKIKNPDRRKHSVITIPKYTYISVPMQIKQAGFKVKFDDIEWEGIYQLKPLRLFDAARRFKKDMYFQNSFMCVSFHYTKILGLNHGGAILYSLPEAKKFFEQMRHDGRTDGKPITNNLVQRIGHHCPMSAETAAQGLVKLASLPKFNKDLPNSDYPDLSALEIFK